MFAGIRDKALKDSCLPRRQQKTIAELCRAASSPCVQKPGLTEYKDEYKKWTANDASVTISLAPSKRREESQTNDVKKNVSAYAFSRGNRFNIPPASDCQPPPERFRFTTTYQTDFRDSSDQRCNTKTPAFPGLPEINPEQLPCQTLCPFTTETTYAQAYDVNQPYFDDACGGKCGSLKFSCGHQSTCEPVGQICIQYSPAPPPRNLPELRKSDLTPPGTDTTDCFRCPKELPCCPCPPPLAACEGCCGKEYFCKLHQATATPTRHYPIQFGVPRYAPDPRDPLPRPKLLCHGGTADCALQASFPTKAAINQARERLMDKLQELRCRPPPEAIETDYRAKYKFPPFKEVPEYCAKNWKEDAHKMNLFLAQKGPPKKSLPLYCLDCESKPADPRPPFHHLSVYGADYVWNVAQRFPRRLHQLGAEQKPLCCPIVCYDDIVEARTEEAERWGTDWCCQGNS